MDISFSLLNKIEELKKNKKLELYPIKFDINSNKYYYRLVLKDYEKRNKRINKLQRPSAWINIFDKDIAKELNIEPKIFYNILRSIGFNRIRNEYYIDLSCYNDLKKEEIIKRIVSEIYKYAI